MQVVASEWMQVITSMFKALLILLIVQYATSATLYVSSAHIHNDSSEIMIVSYSVTPTSRIINFPLLPSSSFYIFEGYIQSITIGSGIYVNTVMDPTCSTTISIGNVQTYVFIQEVYPITHTQLQLDIVAPNSHFSIFRGSHDNNDLNTTTSGMNIYTLYSFRFESGGSIISTVWCSSEEDASVVAASYPEYSSAVDNTKIICNTSVNTIQEYNILLGSPFDG